MSPVLGALGVGARAYGMTAASGDLVPSFDLLNSTILASTTTAVNFSVSAYAGTYKHLQVRVVARSGTTSGSAGDMRFNSNASDLYRTHYLSHDGSTLTSSYYGTGNPAGQAFVDLINITPSTALGWQNSIIDILDFSSTIKNKTIRRIGGKASNDISSSDVVLSEGVWLSTAAITEINLYPRSQSFGIGSRFSLYGLKG